MIPEFSPGGDHPQPPADPAEPTAEQAGQPEQLTGRDQVTHTYSCALPSRGASCDCGAQ